MKILSKLIILLLFLTSFALIQCGGSEIGPDANVECPEGQTYNEETESCETNECEEEVENDADSDCIDDEDDNCPNTFNASQTDSNGDNLGDACDNDEDGIHNDADNCPDISNFAQTDSDFDGTGNDCDDDDDNDGILDDDDNCLIHDNPDQADSDSDGIGDACEHLEEQDDSDGDGILDDGDGSGVIGDNPCIDGNTENCDDNCQYTENSDQCNLDNDDEGNDCDNNMDDDANPDSSETEECTWNKWSDCSGTHSDTDNIPDAYDNCKIYDNPCQTDLDGDGMGDACDGDKDLDYILTDGDGNGIDSDNRCTGGVTAGCDDNCPEVANTDQADDDSDGFGNVCDTCPGIQDTGSDLDEDGLDAACDIDADGDGLYGPASPFFYTDPDDNVVHLFWDVDPDDTSFDSMSISNTYEFFNGKSWCIGFPAPCTYEPWIWGADRSKVQGTWEVCPGTTATGSDWGICILIE